MDWVWGCEGKSRVNGDPFLSLPTGGMLVLLLEMQKAEVELVFKRKLWWVLDMSS